MELLKDPVVQNYGNDRYSKGYEDGYSNAIADRRMRTAKMKNISDAKFRDVLGFIEKLKD